MNRKTFLRLLGIGSVAAVVVPKILAKEPDTSVSVDPRPPIEIDVSRIPDGMSLEDIIKEYKKSGMLVYRDSSPVLYCGEKSYAQLRKACKKYLKAMGREVEPDFKLMNFRGMRVVKHAHLNPNDCIKVNEFYPGSAEWMNNITKSL